MRKSILLIVVATFLSTTFAFADAEARKCASRVKQAGCELSNNNFDRIDDNVESCKNFRTSGKSLEVFLLKDAGKVVVVDTSAGRYTRYCPVAKYTVDRSGIETIKVLGGRLFMLSNAGRVFFMESDQDFYELLNSKRRSYSNVSEIKGADSGRAVRLIGPGFDNELSDDELRAKVRDREVEKINFFWTTTQRSLFRDE